MTPLRHQRLWLVIGIGLVLTVVYLSLTPQAPELGFEQSDKLGHLLAYGTLMNWFCQLYDGRGRRIALAAGFVALGIALELVQGMTDYRTADPMDALANAAGVMIGWLCALPRAGKWLARLEDFSVRR
jgi:VanZ family protein